MSRFLLYCVFAAGVICVTSALWCFPGNSGSAALAGEPAKLLEGPELELASDSVAIIRWTISNPGGTDLHFGVVHYGTDAVHTSQIAKSPNRRNPSHPEMVFRVRIAGLQRQTTYYYRVESTGAAGEPDGPPSPLRTFKTR